MIDKTWRSVDLRGHKCVTLKELQTGTGCGVSKGTVCTIISAHNGVTIQTEPCPCCGQYSILTHVSRNDLNLID